MENNLLLPDDLPSDIELLGDGQSFQDTISDMLMEVKGFESFEQSDLLFLAKHMKAYRARKGTTIFRQRDEITWHHYSGQNFWGNINHR